MLEKTNNPVLHVARNSYQGTIQTDTLKVILARINIIGLYVAKYLYPENTQRDKYMVLLDILNTSVFSVTMDLSPGTT